VGNYFIKVKNTKLRPHQIAAKGIARTFQNIRLFGALGVGKRYRPAHSY